MVLAMAFAGACARSGPPRSLPTLEWPPSIEARVASASREHKRVVLDFHASWCTACTRLADETYAEPIVARALTDRFVLVRVDLDHDPTLGRVAGVGSLPDVRVLDPDGHVVARSNAFMDPQEFLAFLTRAEEDGTRVPDAPRSVGSRKRDFVAALAWGVPVTVFAGIVLYILAGYAKDANAGGPAR